MAKHLDQAGKTVAADDPNRLLWYSAGKLCGMWTDDWDRVGTNGKHGIPCCPTCGAVGMQITAKEWYDGAKEFEAGNPRYLEFVEAAKGICGKPSHAPDFLTRYSQWLDREEGRKPANDPKNPTTWTPEMIKAFSTYIPPENK